MLANLGKHCQNGVKYDHLMTEDLPYKPLNFYFGSKRVEPDSKYTSFS